jgi:protein CWC15
VTAAGASEEEFKAQLLEQEDKAERKRKAEKLGTTAEALEEQAQAEKRLKAITAIDDDLDADDDVDGDSSDADSDDDEADLLRELQRIKAERAQEKEEEEVAKTAEQEQINRENYMRANPLLHAGAAASTDFAIDKRWDDDVVFKNCARNTHEDQSFVNDTLRSDFHRKFMAKYIQ